MLLVNQTAWLLLPSPRRRWPITPWVVAAPSPPSQPYSCPIFLIDSDHFLFTVRGFQDPQGQEQLLTWPHSSVAVWSHPPEGNKLQDFKMFFILRQWVFVPSKAALSWEEQAVLWRLGFEKRDSLWICPGSKGCHSPELNAANPRCSCCLLESMVQGYSRPHEPHGLWRVQAPMLCSTLSCTAGCS